MNSIRWKIILLCAAVIVIPLLVLNSYSIRIFDLFASRSLEEHLIDAAFMTGEAYKDLLDEHGSLDEARQARLTETVRAFGGEIRARIRILSPAGAVLADSNTNAVPGEILADLPEVQAALGGTYRARSALSPDRKYYYYYVAYPVKREEQVCGVAYVSRHTGEIMTIIKQMVLFQRVTTWLAIVIGVFLAALLAQTITRRLRRLAAAAAAFAKGGAPPDVHVGGSDEVAELARAVSRMATEIRRTNQYNREFISTVMHELKMPITAIKGAGELLEQGAFAKEESRVKFLGNIRFEADRLARMVWELNELTKLDTEIPRAQKETVDYGRCVREIVERFETTLDAGHAEIRVAVPDQPVFARIVPDRIEQVIGNLLDNAVRYTPAGGRIEVAVEPGPNGTVVTSVRDTGRGITPANLGKIFDRFFTTEPKDKPKDYGSGLGLAIAKSIVENHQGAIRAESVPDQGATFTITLPAEDA